MPKFIVRQYVDAVVVYDATIEAETPDEAFANAKNAPPNAWQRVSDSEYDHSDAAVFAEDGETELLDAREFSH